MPKVSIPDDFLCPITHELMNDPVATVDGLIYERKAIEDWLQTHNTSPLTNKIVDSKTLISIPFVKKQIDEFKRVSNICSLDSFMEVIKSGDLKKLKTINYLEDYINSVDPIKDNNGIQDKTPLHIAAEKNNISMITFLIDEGASVKNKNNAGEKPIRSAARWGHLDALKLLYKFDNDIEAPNNLQVTALHNAAYNGHLEAIKFLLDNKSNIEAKTNDGYTALLYASQQGHENVVRLLLENKANIEARNSYNSTALHLASKRGKGKVVDLLIKNKANIESTAKGDTDLAGDNKTPLHWAAYSGDEETVKYLLIAKGNTEAEDTNRCTPLHVAAQFGHEKAIKLLLEHGANPETTNKDGRKPSDVSKNKEVAQLISQIQRKLDNEAKLALKEITELRHRLILLEDKNKKLEDRVSELEVQLKTTKK